ncbi:MAG: hypothetical protein KF905_05500 [Flavobacteriales bacterium]|nr:hypothetical protein [Flavobacteriales bacterium]
MNTPKTEPTRWNDMLRIAGVFMVLLFSVCVYALGQGSVDSTKPREETKESLKAEEQEEASNSNNVEDNEGNKGVERPSTEAVGEPTFLRRTSTEWTAIGTIIIALFTVALALTSCLQWKAINKTNETTKKSVDSYVGRERGRLILKKLKRMSSKGGNGFEYQFVNAGPTGIVVHGFNCAVVKEVIRDDGAISIDPIEELTLMAVSYYVKPGGCFGFQNSDDDLIPAKVGIDYIQEEIAHYDLSPDNNIVAVFDFSYETSFGTYNNRHVAAFADFGHVGFPDGTLCYDLPHAEWVEKYGKKKEEKI